MWEERLLIYARVILGCGLVQATRCAKGPQNPILFGQQSLLVCEQASGLANEISSWLDQPLLKPAHPKKKEKIARPCGPGGGNYFCGAVWGMVWV